MYRYVSVVALVSLPGCGGPSLTCREPDVSVYTAEGVENALCDLTFSACEHGEYLTVSCTNDTFDGDYTCSWLLIDGTKTRSGTFPSPDFCLLDTEAMVAALDEAPGISVTVE